MNGLCIRALTRLVLGASCPVCWHSMNAAVIRSEAMATTLRGEIMCGHRGRFRRPVDGADLGWEPLELAADCAKPPLNFKPTGI